MSETTKMYWLHALTPLHVGAGRGVGFIDLPVMREKVTGWPIVPGSAIKGVIADFNKATPEQRSGNGKLKAAFGSADGDDTTSGANAGAIAFTDARLVCLPVRSFYGTFAWVTSPLTLQRLKRDFAMAGIGDELPTCCDVGREVIHVGDPNSVLKDDGKVYLEDLDFSATHCDVTARWGEAISRWLFEEKDNAWRILFQQRFAVVPNNVFDFLCETATQVDAHIRIRPDTKTVIDGALWYEESLPSETVLAGMVRCDRVFVESQDSATDLIATYCSAELNLQMGGKSTVGKGRLRCIFK